LWLLARVALAVVQVVEMLAAAEVAALWYIAIMFLSLRAVATQLTLGLKPLVLLEPKAAHSVLLLVVALWVLLVLVNVVERQVAHTLLDMPVVKVVALVAVAAVVEPVVILRLAALEIQA